MSKLKSFSSFNLFLLVILIIADNSIESALGYKTNLDELILVILNISYLFVLILQSNRGWIRKSELYFITFIIILIISAILNPYSKYLQSSLGIYFIIKSLTVFFLIGRIGIKRKYLNKIINFIIVFSFINFITQVLQLLFINTPDFTWGLIEKTIIKEGFFRAGGVFGNSNRSSQLFVISYILLRIKNYKIINWRVGIITLGILLSASNTGFLSFLLILAIDLVIIEKKKRLILPSLITIGLLVFYWGGSFLFRINQLYDLAVVQETYFRLKSYTISFDVLKQFPIFGVGPGFYGGSVAAIQGGSPYHEIFRTFDYYSNSINKPSTIDAFWPHFWAEVGIMGTIVFLAIITIIIKDLYKKAMFYNSKKMLLAILLILLMLLSGISTFSVESTFSSILVYVIVAGIIDQYKVNEYSKINIDV